MDPDQFDYFHELIAAEEFSRLGTPGLKDGLGGGLVIGLPPVVAFAAPAVRAPPTNPRLLTLTINDQQQHHRPASAPIGFRDKSWAVAPLERNASKVGLRSSLARRMAGEKSVGSGSLSSRRCARPASCSRAHAVAWARLPRPSLVIPLPMWSRCSVIFVRYAPVR